MSDNTERNPLKDAIGKLYALIVMFPDLDPMLRPVILDLEKCKVAVIERSL